MVPDRPFRIAVVVPLKNRHGSFLHALRSIERQVRPADEIIVVDDCSTPPISLPADDAFLSRVRLVRLDTPHGGGGARNVGVDVAQSDVVAFLDSDDEFLEEHLAGIEGAFRARPDAAFVSTRILVSDDRLRPYRVSGSAHAEISHRTLLEHGNVVGTFSAIAVRKQSFLAVGGIPQIKSCQDWALLLALTRDRDGLNVAHPSVLYRSPILSRLDGISKKFGIHMPSYRYLFQNFDFERSPPTVNFRRQTLIFLLALNGKRCVALRATLKMLSFDTLNVKLLQTLLAIVIGKTGYFHILRLKARIERIGYRWRQP